MYVLDTNVYIEAIRRDVFRERLKEFMYAHGGQVYLSTVVWHELLVGEADEGDRRHLRRTLLRPFIDRERLVETDEATWAEAAVILQALKAAGESPSRLRDAGYRFDVLLAASCRRIGATLITANVRDFEPIHRVRGFRYLNQFPA